METLVEERVQLDECNDGGRRKEHSTVVIKGVR
jgi:hypothetical protein